MAQTASTMIFIGNLPIVVTDESNSATENAGAIAGTYVDSEMQMVDITNHDEDNDGVIWSNEFGGPDLYPTPCEMAALSPPSKTRSSSIPPASQWWMPQYMTLRCQWSRCPTVTPL